MARPSARPFSGGPPRGDYGYDAPYASLAFAGGATICEGLASAFVLQRVVDAAVAIGLDAALLGANASSLLCTTRVGKFIEWERILDGVPLRGGERMLDIGWVRDSGGATR